jgi:hypothetical protein
MDSMTLRPFDDPPRDPHLAEALRRVETPLAPEADDALRARIVWEARGRLASRRLGAAARPWWAWMAGWARIAVPVGVAAGVAAGALVLRTPVVDAETSGAETELTVASQSVADTLALSELVLSGTGEPEPQYQVVDHVLGTTERDWVLSLTDAGTVGR